MKYRVTEAGFIDRLVHVGEIIDVTGPPPIGGLVPIDEPPAPPADEVAAPEPPKEARASRKSRAAAPPADTGDEADII